MTARRITGLGTTAFALCVSISTAAAAGTAAPLPPLLAWSESGASGTRPLLASTLSGDAWLSPALTAAAGPFTAPGWPLHGKVARTSPDGRRQAVVFAESDASGRDNLYATFWNGAAWDDGTGAPSGDARAFGRVGTDGLIDFRVFDAAFEAKSGELVVVAGVNTDETVKYWVHSGTTWTTTTLLQSVANNAEDSVNVFDWVRLASMPGTNRIAFLGVANDPLQKDSAAIEAMIWDGDANAWGQRRVLSFPVSNGQNYHRTEAIDVAFTLSGTNAGEAVMVWGRGNQVLASSWREATGWGTVRTVLTLGAGTTVRWLRLAADPSSDDLVLAVGDVDGSTGRLVTVPYDGGTRAWGTASPFHTMDAFGDLTMNRPFDVAWDPIVDRRNVVVAWSDGRGVWSAHSVDGGVGFSSPRAVDDGESAYWVRLERRPDGKIDLAVHDASNDLRAFAWNGYGWAPTTAFPLSSRLETATARDVEAFALASSLPVLPAPPPRGDFNGDGRTDLLWHNNTTGGLFVWFLDGASVAGSSYLRPESFADTRWQIRALGDFNRDGDTDVLWHHRDTGDLYVWFLDGTTAVGGSYLTPRAVPGSAWQIRGTADFDRNGSLDLLWHNQSTGELYVWLMDGLAAAGGAFIAPAMADARWQVRGLGDFDGDGKADIVWHNSQTGQIYTWLLNGTAVASGAFFDPSAVADARWRLAQVSDFDGDRRPDVLWHHQGTGELYIWYMDGTTVRSGGYMSPSRFNDPRWAIAPR